MAGGHRLVVARPVRGRGLLLGAPHPLLPVHYVAVTARDGFPGSWSGAVGRLGVVALGWWRGWPWVRSAEPGRGGWPPPRRCTSPPGPGFLLGAPHPLLPVHYVAVTARDGFPGSRSGAVGRLGVGVLGCWRGGPGPVRRGRLVAGSRRLVVARPLRGRGLCLVLRIRCCPSTTWPSPPGTASLARGRGRSAAWRPRRPVAMPRLAAPHGSRSLLGPETGSRRDSQDLGRCVTCGFTRRPHLRRPASAGFVLAGPRPRHDKAERACTPLENRARRHTPPKTPCQRSTCTPQHAPPNRSGAGSPAQRPNPPTPQGQRPPTTSQGSRPGW
ncbi:hypothetical protein ABIA38_004309 [Embleya sp. AB8]